MVQRLLNILICIDQLLFSIITLGKAYPNETLSSAAYRGEQDGKIIGKYARPLIDAILWFDPLHCYTSYENVRLGRLLPPSYRN